MNTHALYPMNLSELSFNIINGKPIVGNGILRRLKDPATDQLIIEISDGDNEQVDQAVLSAKKALSIWSRTEPSVRGRVLYKLAELIEANAGEIAAIESLNVGKPVSQARRDVLRAADYFRFYAGCCDKLNGDTIPLGPDQTAMTLLEPVGVTAHILPWNYPISTLARGAGPALAVGATLVAKPAEATPLTTIYVAKLAQEAGLPSGAFEVVTGAGDVGETLTSHCDIAHVTFTGSTTTGRKIMQSTSKPVAGITLELGGKSPVIVLADADLDAAADGVIRGIFFNAGQVCAAGARLICEHSIHDELVERVCTKAKMMTIGHGLDDPDIGPLITQQQLERVEGFVDRAKLAELSCVLGGQRIHPDGLPDGLFFPPTIFTDVPADSEVAKNEIFGPVLCTQICEDAEHALKLANDSKFGLVAGIYSSDTTKVMKFSRQVEAGQVFVNGFLQGGDTIPFGGVKESGIGREKGLAGLAAYTTTKSIIINH